MKFYNGVHLVSGTIVAPFAGAWIEIVVDVRSLCGADVAPFAGAWIEINVLSYEHYTYDVAPFAGAWIEIFYGGNPLSVAPFAGAWIEIGGGSTSAVTASESLPSRERGLKWHYKFGKGHWWNGRSLRGSVD